MTWTLTTHDTPCPQAAAQVDAGLDAANGREPALAQVRPLQVYARDAAGQVLGGAVGRTWGGCAELQQLWVADAQRGAGLGTALMRQFEAAAAARGVRLVYLETFSFQAPAFYARCGYGVALTIAGFAPGIEKHVFTKALVPTC